jgi:cobalt-zinc-cadmium efflux system membrane fusion protein
MTTKQFYKTIPALLVALAAALILAGCGGEKAKADPRTEAPPPAKVEAEADSSKVKVDHPDQFPLATAVAHASAPELSVTGSVAADVSRSVPVISLAGGRVTEVHARLGDQVEKGQILLRVRSTDISGSFADYRKAVQNEALAKIQLERATSLFDKGAIAKKEVEVAQNSEDNAKVDLQSIEEKLRVLGVDPQRPDGIVDVPAPVSGIITDQQVTVGSGIQALGAPNPFTISDLSSVWILCDVFENDLAFVRMGDYVDLRLNAYPDRAFRGRVSNIGPVLDPALHTAKVRLELPNPGAIMRIGMFVNATFHGQSQSMHAAIPATAILHLHDRDWVYVPAGSGQFRRVEIVGGVMLPNNLQEVISGLHAGQQVVANALVLQNTVEQ